MQAHQQQHDYTDQEMHMLEHERHNKARSAAKALLNNLNQDIRDGSMGHPPTAAGALGLRVDSVLDELLGSWPGRRFPGALADERREIVDEIHLHTAMFCDKV